MSADPKELQLEQDFFDHAWDLRERFRQNMQQAPTATAHPRAAAHARENAARVSEQLGPPDEAVAFGRLDYDSELTDKIYVGRYAIWDEDNEVVVANWKSDVGRIYQEASLADSLGVTRKRSFRTEGNEIIDFEDLLLAALAAGIEVLEEEYLTPESLLRDLERHRSGEMQDIVATIQAEQSRVMREDPDQLLVIQGGPGTGKSIIALHRASWILYERRGRIGARDLLVVGPSRAFIRYINRVLPGLGDREVTQLPLTALGPTVRVDAQDEPEAARLKGDRRMQTLIDRALQDRIIEPKEPVAFSIAGRQRSVDASRIADALPSLRDLPYADGRARLRDLLRREAGLAATEGGDVLDNAVDTVWPQLTPQSFLRDLWGSENRLVTAAGEDFSAAEVRRLYRRRAERLGAETWSPADVPVLDYADYRISGQVRSRYAHIVVDEAQDLSPMQLDSIARRSATGSYTVIGDLAQSTGNWARDSWDEVLDALRKDLPATVKELENGYRVPTQIFEFAAQVLPWSAPAVRAPRAIRQGPAQPDLHRVDPDSRPEAVVSVAREHASHGLSVGIVCPESLMDEVRAALGAEHMSWADVGRDEEVGSSITLVGPTDAKGLEFEAVIVVEPEEIVGSDARGLRLLYVALTRATKHLAVVHAGEALPIPGMAPPQQATPTPDADGEEPGTGAPGATALGADGKPDAARRLAHVIASDLAAQVRAAVAPELWEQLLHELRRALGDHEELG